MAIDIQFNKDKGYFDFDFVNGDFALTEGLDTALLMSLFLDKRAENSEVSAPYMQRGWWGNLVGAYVNYQIGSKLWLLSQAKRTNNTLNFAKNYTYDCLKWLLDDQLADRIEVTDIFANDNLMINVNIFKNKNLVFSNAYALWNNTQNFGVR